MSDQDIYGYKRNPKPKGVFSNEASKLFISGGSSGVREGSLIQTWNVAYSQNLEELFEIGSDRIYWMKGRPQGSGTIGRVVAAIDADTSRAGIMPGGAYDICEGGATMTIQAVGGHCDTKGANVDDLLNRGVELKMEGVVVTSVGYSMQLPDVRLSENLQWRFAKLSVTATTA